MEQREQRQSNPEPKILLLDIETAPNLGYTWGKWEQDVIDFKKDWYILCFCAKWLGRHRVFSSKLTDFPEFKKDKSDDSRVVKELWRLFNEADIIIAHNGDEFDIKKANARFIIHNLKPPSPYKTIDTKKLARRHFKFDSNKLDELGRYLGLGRKLPHTGKDLWLGCMNGDQNAWRQMMRYNRQDVLLLERIYMRLRGWDKSSLNVNLASGIHCPKCTGSNLQSRGSEHTLLGWRRRFQCTDCGKWCRGELLIKDRMTIQ